MSGARLSVVGLGTWQFGSAEWAYGRSYTDSVAPAVVRRSHPVGPVAIAQTMAVASSTHRANGAFSTSGGFELPLTNMAAALALVVAGPGRYSLDGLTGAPGDGMESLVEPVTWLRFERDGSLGQDGSDPVALQARRLFDVGGEVVRADEPAVTAERRFGLLERLGRQVSPGRGHPEYPDLPASGRE